MEFVRALLHFREHGWRLAGTTVPFPANKHQLLHRVMRIVHNKNKSLNKAERIFFIASFCIISLLLAASTHQVVRPSDSNYKMIMEERTSLLTFDSAQSGYLSRSGDLAQSDASSLSIDWSQSGDPAALTNAPTGSGGPALSEADDRAKSAMDAEQALRNRKEEESPEIQAAEERERAEQNQEQAVKDRQKEEQDRQQAEQNEEQARLDKLQEEKDQEEAGLDKMQEERDALQAQVERVQAEIETAQAIGQQKQAEKDKVQAVEQRQQAEKDKASADKGKIQAKLALHKSLTANPR
jgi:hypothetical protein